MIGGLSAQLQVIRETIELPLKHPEIFRNYGEKHIVIYFVTDSLFVVLYDILSNLNKIQLTLEQIIFDAINRLLFIHFE